MQRRVQGEHDIRMDGIQDLYTRARGASVLDIGCNRGMVALDMMKNGATVIHGCDNYAEGINVARHIFADYRHVTSRFEVVDLTTGQDSLRALGGQNYDIVLMLATYHKIKRLMKPDDLTKLMQHIAKLTKSYFGWRGTSDKPEENHEEVAQLDRDFKPFGLERIHTSYISRQLGVAAIWERQ
jgi:2-polyprenyl-3-methyl-5-hydroxy-6-metoxy-1,4-benzoquinol methylase